MRIGDLARMAGTTTRAVRHYHRVGVLPEPARSANGYRLYQLADLVRLTRIRWLLASGLSLREVGAVVADDPTEGLDLEQELRATLARITEERARLARQELLLRELLARVQAGDELSAVSSEVMQSLNAATDATDPGMSAVVEAERATVSYLAHRGILGDEAQEALAAAYQQVAADPQLADRMTELTARLAALAGADPHAAAAEIDEAAALLNSVLAEVGVERFAGLLEQTAQPAAAGDEVWLAAIFPDPAQRAVMIQALSRRLP